MSILRESDLSIFKKFSGNRPVDKAALAELKASIETSNLLAEDPILVNERLEVLDGQHRLQAAKDMGLPIYYVIKEGGSHQDVILMNANKKTWKREDYLRIYSEGMQNPHYQRLSSFMRENNLNLGQALIIVNGPIKQLNEINDFKSGRFVFPNDHEYVESLCHKVKDFWALLAEHGVKPLHRFRSTACLKPFLVFVTHPQVNWELFHQKLEAWWYKVGVRPSFNLYMDMFSDIYNYRNQQKITIS